MAWPKGKSRASVTVKDPTYQGVSVEHPSIVSSIKNMVKQGRSTEEIQRTIGMPREIIEKYQK
jgi:hypothetical protein